MCKCGNFFGVFLSCLTEHELTDFVIGRLRRSMLGGVAR